MYTNSEQAELIIFYFVDLKSNSALLYNKGHNFKKVFWPEKYIKTEYLPTKRLNPSIFASLLYKLLDKGT